MAASKKKNSISKDPLAFTEEETGNLTIEDSFAETEPEQLIDDDEDSYINDFDRLSKSTNNDEFLEIDGNEVEINTFADFSEEQALDEAAIAEDVVESIINLDATLTIQHVVKLHEKIKKAYSANHTIEINASHVSSIDTSTLQLLVALKKNAVKQQKNVVFADPSERFIESAGLLGLLEILDIDA